MQVLIRGNTSGIRTAIPFSFSGTLHGAILLWVAFSPGPAPPEPRGTIYEQMIKPEERRIVWYNLRERLPDVSAAGARKDPTPPRALRKFNQTLVAGKKDSEHSTQLIYVPAPELNSAKLTPLPNVIEAAGPQRPLREFKPPTAKPIEAAKLTVPDAPQIRVNPEAQMPVDFANPKAPTRTFVPPPQKETPKQAPASLPDAPGVAAVVSPKNLPVAVPEARAPLRRFTPPPAQAPPTHATTTLTEAPSVAAAAPNVSVALPDSRAPLRRFTPPPAQAPPTHATTTLTEAPSVAAATTTASVALPDPRAPLRRFTPPPAQAPPAHSTITYTAPSAAPEAPNSAASGPAPATMAIVGLNPSKAPDFTKPTNSRSADFSAGPDLRKTGGDGGMSDGTLVVPWLNTRGGGKDVQPTLVVNADPMAKENLLAAARAVGAPMPARVSSAPDERLSGRAVYSIAIQMPNVTSYSGSWLVWFAEREPEPGAPQAIVRAPVPSKKVDPKYVAEAAQERIEGAIRLFAIIRKDGHVDSVSVIRKLDPRLDMSAEEALAKWVFDPARRNGVAIDVEAVFEIPFHLAPKSSR